VKERERQREKEREKKTAEGERRRNVRDREVSCSAGGANDMHLPAQNITALELLPLGSTHDSNQ
jgi:hypothetical protein